jgi:hypothetical protein
LDITLDTKRKLWNALERLDQFTGQPTVKAWKQTRGRFNFLVSVNLKGW